MERKNTEKKGEEMVRDMETSNEITNVLILKGHLVSNTRFTRRCITILKCGMLPVSKERRRKAFVIESRITLQ